MKLKVVNDWEYLKWYIGKEEITNKLKSLTIKFNDGCEKKFRIHWKDNHTTVYDHGHEYPVTQKIAYIKINYHGHDILIRLDSLKGIKITEFQI